MSFLSGPKRFSPNQSFQRKSPQNFCRIAEFKVYNAKGSCKKVSTANGFSYVHRVFRARFFVCSQCFLQNPFCFVPFNLAATFKDSSFEKSGLRQTLAARLEKTRLSRGTPSFLLAQRITKSQFLLKVIAISHMEWFCIILKQFSDDL